MLCLQFAVELEKHCIILLPRPSISSFLSFFSDFPVSWQTYYKIEKKTKLQSESTSYRESRKCLLRQLRDKQDIMCLIWMRNHHLWTKQYMTWTILGLPLLIHRFHYLFILCAWLFLIQNKIQFRWLAVIIFFYCVTVIVHFLLKCVVVD